MDVVVRSKREYWEWRTCRSKAGYSRSKAIRLVNRIRDQTGEELRYYRCPVCKRYHLTKDLS